MNSLSWLIYGAELLDNMQVVLGILILAGIVCIAFASVSAGHNTDFGNGKKGDWKIPLKKAWILLIPLVIAAVLPSSRTVYLIAASEAGEAVVTSPDAIEMMGDLRAIIKKRLKEELGE